jgi:hypothetical protein
MNFVKILRDRIDDVGSRAIITKQLSEFSEFSGIDESVTVQEVRSIACHNCEYFTEGKCTSCGCFTQTIIKIVRFVCPQHKW